MMSGTGNAAVDRYLAEGYYTVRGMSSRFAATICGHLVRRQTELGIGGDIAEIGTFEGRFFIALALGLAEGEHAYGIDVFDWPNEGVRQRFLDHCEAQGLAADRFTALKRDTRTLDARTFRGALGSKPIRFFHIDGDHARESLAKDLALVHPVMHPDGLICLDDMLHPGYPMLVVAVHDYLREHPEMRLLCVIDREDIVAAPKFVLCRNVSVPRYEQDLMTTFARQRFAMGGDAGDYHCVVLTPEPKLADVG